MLGHSPPIKYSVDADVSLQVTLDFPFGRLCGTFSLTRKFLGLGLHLASDLLGGTSGFVASLGGLTRHCLGRFCCWGVLC